MITLVHQNDTFTKDIPLPVFYAPSSEDRWINLVCLGVVTIEERVECVRQMIADTSLANPSNIVVDVTQVKNLPTIDDTRKIEFLIGHLCQHFHGRVAILNTVAGHTTVSHIVSIGVGGNCKTVGNRQQARDWFAETHYPH